MKPETFEMMVKEKERAIRALRLTTLDRPVEYLARLSVRCELAILRRCLERKSWTPRSSHE